MLAAIRIVESPYWPVERRGSRPVRIPGHPLVRWLSWQLGRVGLGFEPDLIVEAPAFVPMDAMFDQAGGVIYCAPSQSIEIRRILEEAA